MDRIQELRIMRDRAIGYRDRCLKGEQRTAADNTSDIFWLMGYADWACEVEIIEEELRKPEVMK